jgi:filamentous hemagglutinin
LTKVRDNGDKLFYNPGSNTFAVQRADGALRTMFRPDSGINYWNAQ